MGYSVPSMAFYILHLITYFLISYIGIYGSLALSSLIILGCVYIAFSTSFYEKSVEQDDKEQYTKQTWMANWLIKTVLIHVIVLAALYFFGIYR